MVETLAAIGEFGLIGRIDVLLKKAGGSVPEGGVGIGDDCAVLQPRPGHDLLVTCDAMVEGRHYLPQFISPRDLGRRAMTLNISDIGAMGGIPRCALISLGLRSDTPVKDIEDIYLGFTDELNPFGAVIVGGNITKSEGANFIDITLIGEIETGRSLRRSTAKPGDAILVTGYPGEAAAGLEILLFDPAVPDRENHPLARAYNRPVHRAREGAAVARSGLATAMIDMSDGLLGDLGHICDESRAGARLYEENLPISPALAAAAELLKQAPKAYVTADSDDYELIITCPPAQVNALRSLIQGVSRIPVTIIGEVTGETGSIQMISAGGASRRLNPAG